MERSGKTRTWKRSATRQALRQIKASPGKFLRPEELRGTTLAAASKALARLAHKGVVKRAGKGLYYVPRQTALGTSRPHKLAKTQVALEGKSRPRGVTAANMLGMSTQVAARPQLVVYSTAHPRGAEGVQFKLRSRTPYEPLPDMDAALLEFLREGGRYSELSEVESVARVRDLLLENSLTSTPLPPSAALSPTGIEQHWGSGPAKRHLKLRNAAMQEPPRVRAMLGSLMEWSGLQESLWRPLRESLNPLSRYGFGLFAVLPNAKEWQAK